MIDPYTPQDRIDADERAQALVPGGWLEYQGTPRFILRFFGFFISAILGAVATALWIGGVSWGQEMFWCVLGGYGVSQAPVLNAMYRERAARRTEEALEREYDFDPNEYPRSVSHGIWRMGKELHDLPWEIRNDARPLWENAMRAADLVMEKPTDRVAIDAFNARAKAVHKLYEAHSALEAAALAKDEALQAQELERRHAPIRDELVQNTDDVRAVEIYVEALRAGSAKIRELS